MQLFLTNYNFLMVAPHPPLRGPPSPTGKVDGGYAFPHEYLPSGEGGGEERAVG